MSTNGARPQPERWVNALLSVRVPLLDVDVNASPEQLQAEAQAAFERGASPDAAATVTWEVVGPTDDPALLRLSEHGTSARVPNVELLRILIEQTGNAGGVLSQAEAHTPEDLEEVLFILETATLAGTELVARLRADAETGATPPALDIQLYNLLRENDEDEK